MIAVVAQWALMIPGLLVLVWSFRAARRGNRAASFGLAVCAAVLLGISTLVGAVNVLS